MTCAECGNPVSEAEALNSQALGEPWCGRCLANMMGAPDPDWGWDEEDPMFAICGVKMPGGDSGRCAHLCTRVPWHEGKHRNGKARWK